MGSDAALGMLAIRQAGGVTVAQDEDTSVVWGMPGAAVKHGGVREVLPLERMAEALLRLAVSGGASADAGTRMGATG
jgi:two-component system chemotaxis response regulator CheB